MEHAKSHDEMREELLAKAATDGNFRDQLVNDPKAAIKDTFGIELPDAMSVQIHEDSATAAHLVLPPTASLDGGDLEAVAGGDRKTDFYGANVGHSHPGDWRAGSGHGNG